MFQPWRWKIRAAQGALRGGRLDEAGRLVKENGLDAFRPGQKLTDQVAGQMIARAGEQAALGQTSAGWRDLDQAAELIGEQTQIQSARRKLLDQSLAEVESLLAADDIPQATLRMDKLQRRHPSTAALRTLRQIAGRLERARSFARQGRQSDAETELAGAAALRPDLKWLDQRLESCRQRGLEARRQQVALHQALVAEDWAGVLDAAETILETMPRHDEARAARRRAWAAVGLKTTRSDIGAQRRSGDNKQNRRSTHHARQSSHEDTVTGRTPAPRFALWIDAVGGFLVCLGDEIVLGPPTSDAVDVPILADISRRHAVIRRDGEGYLIEPVRAVKIDGKPQTGMAALDDGNLIELGEGVELRFRKPHALSGTARLEMVSGHKTDPSCDAILLMAESCVLGPGWHSHVVCRDWEQDVVLFRKGDELCCRSQAGLTINGQTIEGAGALAPGAQVAGEGLAFVLEEL